MEPLERTATLELWSDEKIQPGSEWREEIRDAIKKARVAVLLVSADFLASDFIHRMNCRLYFQRLRKKMQLFFLLL